MVVAANRRAQTNHRVFEFSGAATVDPGAAMLAVLLDIVELRRLRSINSFAALLLRGVKHCIASTRACLLESACAEAQAPKPIPSAWYSRHASLTNGDLCLACGCASLEFRPTSFRNKTTLRLEWFWFAPGVRLAARVPKSKEGNE